MYFEILWSEYDPMLHRLRHVRVNVGVKVDDGDWAIDFVQTLQNGQYLEEPEPHQNNGRSRYRPVHLRSYDRHPMSPFVDGTPHRGL